MMVSEAGRRRKGGDASADGLGGIARFDELVAKRLDVFHRGLEELHRIVGPNELQEVAEVKLCKLALPIEGLRVEIDAIAYRIR